MNVFFVKDSRFISILCVSLLFNLAVLLPVDGRFFSMFLCEIISFVLMVDEDIFFGGAVDVSTTSFFSCAFFLLLLSSDLRATLKRYNSPYLMLNRT